MRMRGLLLLAALLLCLAAAACAETAEAAPAELRENGFVYTVDPETGEAAVERYEGTDTEVEIPRTLGGSPVTSVKAWAFEDRAGVTAVTVPEGVVSVGAYAFCRCAALTRVSLPDSLEEIGACCFILCTSLEELTLPPACDTLGANPFVHCTALKTLNLPEGGPLTLRGGLLYDREDRRLIALLPALAEETVTVPAGCRTLGRFAFVACGGLKELRLPASVSALEDYAVYACTDLERLTASDSVRAVGDGVFVWCDGLTVSAPAGSFLAAYCEAQGIRTE